MTVLAIVAHADDETLGCGGALARHARVGEDVHILVVADGVASRTDATDDEKDRRQAAARAAAEALGARPPVFLDYPDQRLDQTPLLDVTQAIERVAADLKPTVVYTHFGHDLNADHRIVSAATLTAFRPTPGQSVCEIYAFETLSSTEWAYGSAPFQPTRFVDIETTLEAKLAALKCYDMEMRPFPHSRSYEAVRAQAALRGANVGVAAAEAFVVLRQVI